MKHQILLATALLLSLTAAFAAEDSQPAPDQSSTTPVVTDSMNQIVKQNRRLRIVLGGGLTLGGDTLGTLVYTNGSTESIHAGELLLLHAGVDYRLSDQISLQSTLGYHLDATDASNGDVTFSRYPLDLLAYYNVSDAFRIGGGTSIVFNPRLKGSGFASGFDASFDNTIGMVVEGEYRVLSMLGITFRYVSEKYRQSGNPYTINGSYFGVLANVYL